MTRETKAGLVVACSFLCLVGVVLYSRMRENTKPPDSGEVAEHVATPPAPLLSTPSPNTAREGSGMTLAVTAPAGADARTVPIPGVPMLVPTPTLSGIQQVRANDPASAAQPLSDPIRASNNSALGAAPAFEVPATSAAAATENRPLPPPNPEGNVGGAVIPLPVPAAPGSGESPSLPWPDAGRGPEVRPTPTPGAPKYGLPSAPASPAAAFEVPGSSPPTAGAAVNVPLPTPAPNSGTTFTFPVEPSGPGGSALPDRRPAEAPGQGPLPPPEPPATFPAPGVPTPEPPRALSSGRPEIPPPPQRTIQLGPPATAPIPANSFTQGTTLPGTLPPPLQPGDSRPAASFGVPSATVTSPSNLGLRAFPPSGNLPQVDSYDEETYRCKPNDSFRAISTQYYNSDKYAQALWLFNRNHPLATDALRQDPPALQPGQPVYIPPTRILEKYYASTIIEQQPPAGGNGLRR